MNAPFTIQIVWRGIAIRVDYHARRWNGPCDHVEITSDNRVPLPVTETGYRSHFLPAGVVTPDTLEAQVTAWLDEEAAKPEWQHYQEASRQMTLF
ncbi:hypothetical protein [Rhodovulum sp. YEN HP10]|uniref:hypothetical protein n=1 Tax=Rhodovulum sp. HP10 TaxID=3387397 RepID=UPI0039DFC858